MEHIETFVAYKHPVTRYSGFGIASFVIAIVAGLLEFVLVAAAGVLEATTPGGIDENSPVAVLLGLALIRGLLVDILGIGLGIASLCQPTEESVRSSRRSHRLRSFAASFCSDLRHHRELEPTANQTLQRTAAV